MAVSSETKSNTRASIKQPIGDSLVGKQLNSLTQEQLAYPSQSGLRLEGMLIGVSTVKYRTMMMDLKSGTCHDYRHCSF